MIDNVVELRPDDRIVCQSYGNDGYILIDASRKDARELLRQLEELLS